MLFLIYLLPGFVYRDPCPRLPALPPKHAAWMSPGPDLGDLAGDGHQVPLLVPYFSVGFKQPAGHEAGPEGGVTSMVNN